MTNNDQHEYQLQQLTLYECICRASHGELLTALIGVLNQCHREDLADYNAVSYEGTLRTKDIYVLLNDVLDPHYDPKERDAQ